MANSSPAATRARRVLRKSITFAAGSGTGDVGTVAAITTTGTCLISAMNLHCTTDLTSSGGTISFGITGDTAALIPVTTASGIDAGLNWTDAEPRKIADPIGPIVISDNLLFTIATAGITAGVIEIEIVYDSLSGNGILS